MRRTLRSCGASALTTLAPRATPPAATAATAVAQPALVPPLQQAENAITTDLVLAHSKVLASDEFEGRLPGTPGEDKSVAYITEQFKALKRAPGNPDGTYIQDVPLVGIDGTSRMQMASGGKQIGRAQV